MLPQSRLEGNSSYNLEQCMPADDKQCTREVQAAYRLDTANQIGEGRYGKVYIGDCKVTRKKVALKKIKLDVNTEEGGFPKIALREIKILGSLKHDNVVNLREVVRTNSRSLKDDILLAFDYAEYDLTGLMAANMYKMTEAQTKCIVKQLLKGLAHVHGNDVLHRDLKPANILVNKDGVVKLADFGMARACVSSRQDPLTPFVVTLWYRPPELLLSDHKKDIKYGPEVDMWSVGCILAELLMGQAIFPGNDDVDQVDQIFKVMGTPTSQTWPGVERLTHWDKVPKGKYRTQQLRQRLNEVMHHRGMPPPHPSAFDLVEQLLSMDPTKRPSALDAFQHPWFWSHNPPPCEPIQLPVRGTGHEHMLKKKRQQERDEHARGEWDHAHRDKRARYDSQPAARAPPPRHHNTNGAGYNNSRAPGTAASGPLGPARTAYNGPLSGYMPPPAQGRGQGMRPPPVPSAAVPQAGRQTAPQPGGQASQMRSQAMPPPPRSHAPLPHGFRQAPQRPGNQASGSHQQGGQQAPHGRQQAGQSMLPSAREAEAQGDIWEASLQRKRMQYSSPSTGAAAQGRGPALQPPSGSAPNTSNQHMLGGSAQQARTQAVHPPGGQPPQGRGQPMTHQSNRSQPNGNSQQAWMQASRLR